MKNNKWKSFVVPFILTIVVSRIFLFMISPENFQYNDKFHHAYIGILILFIIGVMYYIKKRVNMVFFGIGMGLFIDEIFYFFSKGSGYQKYWNKLSDYGTVLLAITIIAVYFIFNHIKNRKIKSSP